MRDCLSPVMLFPDINKIDEKYLEIPRKTHIPVPAQKSGADNNSLPGMIRIRKKNFKKIANTGNVIPPDHDEETGKLQPGMMVMHDKFGKGKIISIEGTGSNRKATVFFSQVGNKQLLLKFARLKVIDQ